MFSTLVFPTLAPLHQNRIERNDAQSARRRRAVALPGAGMTFCLALVGLVPVCRSKSELPQTGVEGARYSAPLWSLRLVRLLATPRPRARVGRLPRLRRIEIPPAVTIKGIPQPLQFEINAAPCGPIASPRGSSIQPGPRAPRCSTRSGGLTMKRLRRPDCNAPYSPGVPPVAAARTRGPGQRPARTDRTRSPCPRTAPSPCSAPQARSADAK